MEELTALVAGDGHLPLAIAERLYELGRPPVIYSLRENSEDISKYAVEIVPLSKPDLGFTLKDMKKRGIKSIFMAGIISKTLIYKPSLFDLTTQRFLASLIFRDDHSLLAAIVDFIEKEGFKVLSYREIIPDMLASAGHIAGPRATKEQMKDVDYGFSICKVTAPLSFGQTVVVYKHSVVAVEALEGTDATLLRAGSLCKGGTVTKMMRLDQDTRYDIPTVGPGTLRQMADAKLKCLALHAGRTLILEMEKFKQIAEEKEISVIGVEICQSS